MPYYKRKKVKRAFFHKKSIKKTNNDIAMNNVDSNSRNVVPDNKIKVLRGNKYKQKQRSLFLLSVVSIIAAVCILLSCILPVGLYENFVNFTSILGSGSYPNVVSGSSIINSVSNGYYYFVLTDTNLTAYSNGGKVIFNDLHGFSNPILSVSDTRALVYDQGQKAIYIYNLTGRIHSIETKSEIITASISKNGDFAVATYSDSYTSAVNVYNKSADIIFTWNSAKDIVNNVLVNPKGDKLAVSTLNASSGEFVAKLLIFNFESADPIHSLDMGNSVALSLSNTGNGISVISAQNYKFIHWKKFSSNDFASSGEINMFRNTPNGLLLVCNRAHNRSDNTIVLISKKGEKISEFKINGLITDIQYSKGRTYFVNDATINILDKEGNRLKHDDCGNGIKKFSVISANSIAAITDDNISQINIEKGD